MRFDDPRMDGLHHPDQLGRGGTRAICRHSQRHLTRSADHTAWHARRTRILAEAVEWTSVWCPLAVARLSHECHRQETAKYSESHSYNNKWDYKITVLLQDYNTIHELYHTRRTDVLATLAVEAKQASSVATAAHLAAGIRRHFTRGSVGRRVGRAVGSSGSFGSRLGGPRRGNVLGDRHVGVVAGVAGVAGHCVRSLQVEGHGLLTPTRDEGVRRRGRDTVAAASTGRRG